jgi:hypothetical protein
MRDELKRWMEGTATDSDKKYVGQVAQQLKQSEQGELLQAIRDRFLQENTNPAVIIEASQLFWYGKGLASVFHELDLMIQTADDVVDQEKGDTNISGDIDVSYGESFEVSKEGDLI